MGHLFHHNSLNKHKHSKKLPPTFIPVDAQCQNHRSQAHNVPLRLAEAGWQGERLAQPLGQCPCRINEARWHFSAKGQWPYYCHTAPDANQRPFPHQCASDLQESC